MVHSVSQPAPPATLTQYWTQLSHWLLRQLEGYRVCVICAPFALFGGHRGRGRGNWSVKQPELVDDPVRCSHRPLNDQIDLRPAVRYLSSHSTVLTQRFLLLFRDSEATNRAFRSLLATPSFGINQLTTNQLIDVEILRTNPYLLHPLITPVLQPCPSLVQRGTQRV